MAPGARHAGERGSRAGRASAASDRRAIAGASGDGRRLEVVALGGEEAGERLGVGEAAAAAGIGGLPRPARPAKTAAGRDRHARVGEHQPEAAAGRAGASLSPMPVIRQARPARQTGTSAPRPRTASRRRQRRLPEPGEQPQRRRGVGGAAADAARDRQRLGRAAAPRRGPAAGAAPRRAARGCRRRRRGRGRRGRRWRATRPAAGSASSEVAEAGEDHQAVEQV